MQVLKINSLQTFIINPVALSILITKLTGNIM